MPNAIPATSLVLVKDCCTQMNIAFGVKFLHSELTIGTFENGYRDNVRLDMRVSVMNRKMEYHLAGPERTGSKYLMYSTYLRS